MAQNLQLVYSKLHEFADFLKKSLILSITYLVFGFLSFVTLFEGGNYQANLFFTSVMILIEVVLIIFQALMLHRLYQAKESNNNKELLKSFQFMLGAIIVGILLVFVGSGFFGLVLMAIQIILNLNGWSSLTTYFKIRINCSGSKLILLDLKDGMKYYSNSAYSSIVALFFIWLGQLGNATGFLILLGIIDVVINCFIIYSLFRLANAMLSMTIEDFAVQTPMPKPIAPNDQTFQQPVAEDVFEAPAYDSPFDDNEPNPDKFCPMCGSLNEKKAIFCIACGSKF